MAFKQIHIADVQIDSFDGMIPVTELYWKVRAIIAIGDMEKECVSFLKWSFILFSQRCGICIIVIQLIQPGNRRSVGLIREAGY